MRIAIYSRKLIKGDLPFIQTLFNILSEEKIRSVVYAPYYHEIKKGVDFKQKIELFKDYEEFLNSNVDFMITLGGDGTILRAITIVKDSNVPILGINLGRLGFLASIEKTTIKNAIFNLKRKKFTIEERVLLKLTSNAKIFTDFPYALNDFTITKRDTSSMITISTTLDDDFLNSYWADGVILSTPTGSTGYSLSCGGPIVFPNSGNFVLTPVAPHNLTIRPIVISDNSKLTFQVEGRGETYLCSLDSRQEMITSDHIITLQKSDFKIKLVKLEGISFKQTLRDKLAWGEDKRNRLFKKSDKNHIF